MTGQLKDFHHYKGNDLSRFEKVERKVIELILETKIADEHREDSKVFELKHASGCTQIARILAQKRNLNVEIADVAATLHDIYVIVNGTYKDHAKLGAPIAKQILLEIGGFSEEEIKTICDAVVHHSEKEIYSKEPYIELVKDVDVFDCSLYKGAEGFYKIHKSDEIFKEYVKRIKAVRKELGLNPEEVFRN
ncbi:MAG TPA: HD domain-containing protein [Candidatus Saccharimonadales bacterium]|nr:HD domain-containing protein [Candidatus Saccharimonadales bacterium]